MARTFQSSYKTKKGAQRSRNQVYKWTGEYRPVKRINKGKNKGRWRIG